VSNKKAAAIAEILKMRDQLVVMRERLFQLKAATAASCVSLNLMDMFEPSRFGSWLIPAPH